MSDEPIRVMVVDDQSDVRFLVGVILGEHEDLEVVAEAPGADEALAGLDEARPDVAVVDARMPRIDGYELTGRLLERRPELRVVLLTSIVDDVIEQQALSAGAHTVASKADFDALPDVIRSLSA